MKREERIKELYAQAFDTVEASPQLAEMVESVPQTEPRPKARRGVKAYRLAAALAAAVILTAATGVIVSANKTYRSKYTTVYFNGEKTEARYGSQSIGTENEDRCFELALTRDDMICFIEVFGDLDPRKDTLYIEEHDGCVAASTVPDIKPNLYEDIDRSPYAEIVERYGSQWLMISFETSLGTTRYGDNLAWDGEDGVKDGYIHTDPSDKNDKRGTTYTITPEGAVVIVRTYHSSDIPDFDRHWNEYHQAELVTEGTPDNA